MRHAFYQSSSLRKPYLHFINFMLENRENILYITLIDKNHNFPLSFQANSD